MAELEKHFVFVSLIVGVFNKMIYFYAEFTPDTMTSKPEATNGTAAVFAAVSERKNANAALKKSILNCFFRERQLMIPEISRLTGYSIPTVARYIHDSLDAGLVIASKTAPRDPAPGAQGDVVYAQSGCGVFSRRRHQTLRIGAQPHEFDRRGHSGTGGPQSAVFQYAPVSRDHVP